MTLNHHGRLRLLGARMVLAALAMLSLLGMLGGCTLPPPVGPQVWTLADGAVLPGPELARLPTQADDVPRPPAANDPRWRAVRLPDAWDTQRPQHQGYVWYRLSWATPPGLSAHRPLAVYLPYVSMNGQVWVNGSLVGQQGRLHEPVTRHFYSPLTFELPHSLLRPPGEANEVWVLVAGYRTYRSGLGLVHVGDAVALQAAHASRHFWQNTGTLVTSTIVLAVAAYGAVMWWRLRREPMFGWFTVAATVWGLRNLNFVLTELPFGWTWDNVVWSQWSVMGAMVFVGLFALFTLSYSHWVLHKGRPPWWQQAIPLAFAAVGAVLLGSPDDTAQTRVWFRPLGTGGLLLTLWSQWHLLRTAWLVRSKQVAAVALAGLVYLALMGNDLAVANDHVGLGQVFLRQYAAVPLFLSVTLVWTHRYWLALGAAEKLSDSLQQQVAEQRQVLERNFERLIEADRERAVAQERSRMLSDLHDGLGLHLLTAMKLAQQAQPPQPALVDTLQDGLDDLRLAIDSLGNLEDRDPVLLLASLRFRLAPRLAQAGVQLDWQVQGDLPPQPWLNAACALHLLRLVQEALTNAVRHGRATRLRLGVMALPEGGVEISLWDNGVGLPSESPGQASPAGHGLASMQRRAQALSARLHVGQASDGGTLWSLRLGEGR